MAYMQAYKTPQQWLDPLQASQRPSVRLSDRLIAWGIARDRQQSQWVLIGLIIIVIVVALFAMGSMVGSTGAASDPEKSAEMAKMRQMMPLIQGEPPR